MGLVSTRQSYLLRMVKDERRSNAEGAKDMCGLLACASSKYGFHTYAYGGERRSAGKRLSIFLLDFGRMRGRPAQTPHHAVPLFDGRHWKEREKENNAGAEMRYTVSRNLYVEEALLGQEGGGLLMSALGLAGSN